MASTFAAWLAEQAARFDTAVAQIASELPNESDAALNASLRYALSGEGKRVRPALCVAAFRALRTDARDADVTTLACAVELLHTYSLIHDDLPSVDNDDLRRGRPTTHVVYGTQAALYAGAALIPLAFRTLLNGARELGLSAQTTCAAARELAQAAGGAGMVGGQVLDLEAEGRATSLDDLENLHRAKTGALIAAAARIGALAGGADGDTLKALRTYGRCVGLAFQITDDVLDVTATSGGLGKTTGKDRAVAKATYPAFMGLEGARRHAETELDHALAALDSVGLRTPELEGLAQFAIDRKR